MGTKGLGRVVATLLLALTCLAGPLDAAAAPPPRDVEGTVLSVEGSDVIVDLGSPQGVVEGDVLELWRAIQLLHPVTRKPIRDRYEVGTLKVLQVRERLAVTVPVSAPRRPPAPGDTVILRREPEKKPAKREPASTPGAVAPQMDGDAAAVAALFDSLSGASPVDRIRAYVAYVRKNPKSPYARILREDAVQYHRLLKAQQEPAGPVGAPAPGAPGASASQPPGAAPVAEPAPSTLEPIQVDFAPPPRGLPGRPLDVGLRLSISVAGAVLHVRNPGDVGYRPIPMVSAGSGHYRATIPSERMRPPEVQYFIERVDARGRSFGVLGSEDQPLTIEVERAPRAEPTVLQQSTTASMLVDYADFNRFKGNDRTLQVEGTLGMRFADVGVRALRSGFGVYQGKGGSLQELDVQHLEPRSVGLKYGYLEGELGFVRRASLMIRAVCGLTEDGVVGGALAMVRIGSDQETNLALGGEVLGGVGARSITQLEIREFPRVPILLRSEVSNQPAGTLGGILAGRSQERGELGLRTIVQVGYEFLPGFVVALRLSGQGRTINHYGMGGGGAVTYTW